MTASKVKRIAIIGNSCAGKTTLSRKLSAHFQIQCTHIDSIQFLPGLKIRPLNETRDILIDITNQEKWIIDGFGPLDLLEKRLEQADIVVMIDMPLWLHLWWFFKRQFLILFRPRFELPKGCSEFNLSHTLKIFRTIIKIHKQMRPELLRILQGPRFSAKVIYIKNRSQLQFAAHQGLHLKI